jgi:peptidoglycan/xylan/chitin deacetylase (PgdA/CDA1 family)
MPGLNNSVETSENTVRLEKGAFTISLDFELIWGTLDLFGPERFRRACEIEREKVIDSLLDLFVEFEVPATWCILGHLFLDKCNGQHPEIIRTEHEWVKGDWFDHEPCEAENDKSIFSGRSLVEKIKNCPVRQEIGSHSFSHVIFSDNGCSRAAAESELAESVRLAKEMQIEMRSFAFPRNEIGHLDVLKEFGFLCYRGIEPNWYENRRVPEALRRAMRLVDVLRAAEPPTVLPQTTKSGIWNIPGSSIYFPMHGFRKYIPLKLRTLRAFKGLDSAVKNRRIFHLWFHPTNLADETETMIKGLREILQYAANLRGKDKLQFLSMQDLICHDK